MSSFFQFLPGIRSSFPVFCLGCNTQHCPYMHLLFEREGKLDLDQSIFCKNWNVLHFESKHQDLHLGMVDHIWSHIFLPCRNQVFCKINLVRCGCPKRTSHRLGETCHSWRLVLVFLLSRAHLHFYILKRVRFVFYNIVVCWLMMSVFHILKILIRTIHRLSHI